MEGGKIDKIGGYIADLRRVGTKLVADVRTTSEDMLEKITNGTYISRSAEIGMYEDNKGNIYDPILYGFAWVDIPAVEGLSPQFSFSKDAVNLVNLNSNMGEEKQFPPVEKQEEEKKEETEEESTEEKSEETTEENKEEEKEEEKTIEATKTVEVTEFAKAFPAEFAALEAAKVELAKAKELELSSFVKELVKEGKVVPAMEEKETEFVKSLDTEQFAQYSVIKKDSPAIVKFDAEEIEAGQKQPGSEVEPTATEKADEFLEAIK
jgi:hypothetical protein